MVTKPKERAAHREKSAGLRIQGLSVATTLKWAGGITAILSLIFGLNQLKDLVRDTAQRHRRGNELWRVSKIQEDGGDYAAAWKSLEEAAQLVGDTSKVRVAREDLAMRWLENARIHDNETFASLAGPLLPVLDRATLTAATPRKADLLAHLGWADFLRSRDGIATQPEKYYRQALAIDSGNVYAHAMLGHWLLWNGGPLSGAREHFAAALAAGREHAYVRRLQLQALLNVHNEDADLEFIRVVNEMRQRNEPIDERTRSDVWGIYYSEFGRSPAGFPRSLAGVPAGEQLATFGWLFDRADFDQYKMVIREYYRAILQEAAGQRIAALQTLHSARSMTTDDPNYSTLRRGIDSAILRVSKRQ